MRQVSYYQSVFDLLDIQPPNSAEARSMIESRERQKGRRLPEAVRQWYLIENVVALRDVEESPDGNEEGHLWYDYSNMDHPEPLEAVLRQFAQDFGKEPPTWGPDRIRVLVENQGVCSWFIQPDGSDDPPVVVDEHFDYRPDHPDGSRVLEWVKVADHFSEFIFDWIAGFYFEEWTPLSERDFDEDRRLRPAREKSYLNGLWLHAPDAEAVPPPCLDYLMENFSEDSRQEIAERVLQYRFHNLHGHIRLTTDDYGEGGVSVWWLHANTEEDLYRLVKKVVWWCDLRRKLRHRTEIAGPVLDRLQGREKGP